MTLTEGLLSTPTVWWADGDGDQIVSAEDVIVSDPLTVGLTTTVTIFFDPIRTRDEGIYICMASLSSLALNSILTSSTNNSVDVQLSKTI